MAKDRFEFGLAGTADEVADYLLMVAAGLHQGQVSLESGARALRLSPAAEVTLALRVGLNGQKGKITLEIGWRRRERTRASDLRVQVESRRELVI